jgi:hypothetical protein
MSIILGFDPAGDFGWAIFDTDKPYSAIETGTFKLPRGKLVTKLDKLFELRKVLVPMLKEYRPTETRLTFAAVEAPFDHAPRYAKKGKTDMITGIVEGGDGDGEASGMNTKTISVAGALFGGVVSSCLCWNIAVTDPRPGQWQTIIPKSIKAQFPGAGQAKKRAKATCDLLRVMATNEDARDAACIAMWAMGSDAYKKIRNAHDTRA